VTAATGVRVVTRRRKRGADAPFQLLRRDERGLLDDVLGVFAAGEFGPGERRLAGWHGGSVRWRPHLMSPPGVRLMTRTVVLVLCGLAIGGCATSGERAPVVRAATAQERATLIDKVKGLEGTWEMDGEGGTKQSITFDVIAGGSAVKETMFPGTEHEMVNLYHMDGPSLVMTHYCAGGNQPRMRAESAGGDRIALRMDSVSNLTAAKGGYMGDLTLVMADRDTLREEWQSYEGGKATAPMVFELKRRR